MVPRYTRPEMAAIWAPENRYRLWFAIEAAAADGMEAVGAIPAGCRRRHPRQGASRCSPPWARPIWTGSMPSRQRRATT